MIAKSEKKKERQKNAEMDYDATQRIKLWQQGRDNRAQVSVPSTMTSTDMRTCPSALQHHTNSQTPSIRTSNTPASPALLKHKQRIAHARLKKQKKSEVPHVTGKNWSGKTTIARAPQLSCFRKKNSYSYSSNAAAPMMKHGVQKQKNSSTTTAWNNSSNTSHSSNASKKRMQRGSFSSPRPTKTLVDGPKNDRHNGAAIEYVPQNDGNTGSGVFANELMALRNQLQAEERRHILLQAEKANAHVLGKAIPQASDAPQAPTQSFSCIAPPAPPMCPPPTLGGGKRSNQQSPEPFSNVLHRPVGTAEISRVPVPCVPFENNAAGSEQYEVNNDNENTNDENNNTWTTNDGAHKSIPQKKPNWTSIQQTIHSMIDKDVKKRKQMEHRLRSLEENNLKILGVNINQFKEICGKGPVILSPAPSHTPTKRSARAAKSNQKHVQRMGKAMHQKINRSSPRSGTSKRSILSKQGGSLSRSSRGLSL